MKVKEFGKDCLATLLLFLAVFGPFALHMMGWL